MPIASKPESPQFGLFDDPLSGTPTTVKASSPASPASLAASNAQQVRKASDVDPLLIASMPEALRQNPAMVELYAQLPIPQTPSPLLLAARRHDAEIGKALLETLTRWDLNENDPFKEIPEGATPVTIGEIEKENEQRGNALSRWLSPMWMSSSNHQPHRTVLPDQQEVAIEMMHRGADIWKETPTGGNALVIGAVHARNAFVKAAIASPQWSLEKAQAGQLSDALVHLRRGKAAQPQQVEMGQQDLFTYAIARDNLTQVRLLHTAGWDINRKDHAGNCPLGAARSFTMVEFLLAQGADPFSASTKGVSALKTIQSQVTDTTIREQMAKAIMTLQVASAKKNGDPLALEKLREANRGSLFEAARVSTQSSFVGIWKKFKFDLSIERDERGRTIAMVAAQGGRYASAGTAIREGKVDPLAQDNAGYQLGAYWAFSEAASGSNKDDLLKHIALDGRNAQGFSIAHQALNLREPFFTKKLKENQSYGKGSVGAFLGGLDALASTPEEKERVWNAMEPDGRSTGEHLCACLGRLFNANPKMWGESHYYNTAKMVAHIKTGLPSLSQNAKNETLSWLLEMNIDSRNLRNSTQKEILDLILSLGHEAVDATVPNNWAQRVKEPELRALCERLSLREALREPSPAGLAASQASPPVPAPVRRAARL